MGSRATMSEALLIYRTLRIQTCNSSPRTSLRSRALPQFWSNRVVKLALRTWNSSRIWRQVSSSSWSTQIRYVPARSPLQGRLRVWYLASTFRRGRCCHTQGLSRMSWSVRKAASKQCCRTRATPARTLCPQFRTHRSTLKDRPS